MNLQLGLTLGRQPPSKIDGLRISIDCVETERRIPNSVLLANFESGKILCLLEYLRRDLRHSMETTNGLGPLFKDKLIGVQETTDSMDSRLRQLEASGMPFVSPRDATHLSSAKVLDGLQSPCVMSL
jgi:hypothetical protein